MTTHPVTFSYKDFRPDNSIEDHQETVHFQREEDAEQFQTIVEFLSDPPAWLDSHGGHDDSLLSLKIAANRFANINPYGGSKEVMDSLEAGLFFQAIGNYKNSGYIEARNNCLGGCPAYMLGSFSMAIHDASGKGHQVESLFSRFHFENEETAQDALAFFDMIPDGEKWSFTMTGERNPGTGAYPVKYPANEFVEKIFSRLQNKGAGTIRQQDTKALLELAQKHKDWEFEWGYDFPSIKRGIMAKDWATLLQEVETKFAT
ncbi:MAG: hypothetical protein Q7S68_03555 [Deltaproteobacteria bacterium]|nr:hypothetical protein [Deltaproteobacteria bacterium]